MIPEDLSNLPDSYDNVSLQYKAVLWVLFTMSIISGVSYILKVYVIVCGKRACRIFRKHKHSIIKSNDYVHIISIFSMLSGVVQFLSNSTRVCAGWYIDDL